MDIFDERLHYVWGPLRQFVAARILNNLFHHSLKLELFKDTHTGYWKSTVYWSFIYVFSIYFCDNLMIVLWWQCWPSFKRFVFFWTQSLQRFQLKEKLDTLNKTKTQNFLFACTICYIVGSWLSYDKWSKATISNRPHLPPGINRKIIQVVFKIDFTDGIYIPRHPSQLQEGGFKLRYLQWWR